MAMTDFTLIRRSMAARLFSTATTILTVAVAVGLMLLLLSLREAGRDAFQRGSGNMHLLVSRDSSALVSVLNGIFFTNAPQRPIEWAKIEELRGEYPFEWAIPTQLGDSYRGFPVLATTPELFEKFRPDGVASLTLEAGGFFDAPFEVVLGAAAARGTGLKVGDRIHLTHGIEGSRERLIGRTSSTDKSNGAPRPEAHVHTDFSYTVVGLLEPTGASHDRALFTDLASAWIIHAHDRRTRENPELAREPTTEADLTGADRLVTGLYVRLPTRPGSDTPAALQQIYDMLRRDTSITVAQPGEEIKKLFGIVESMDNLFIGMAAVVMVSSAIAIMLALYNSMEQRRRQIAILRVLGCSRGRISGLVLTESALLGLLGAAAGVALCFLGGQIASGLMRRTLGLVVHPTLDARDTLLTVMATVALACLAGIVPSIVAYRTPVARHLKPIG